MADALASAARIDPASGAHADPEHGPAPIVPLRYRAFLSYSHKDARVAARLHRALESYRLPKSLVGRQTPDGPAPQRLTPIFRDRDELGAASDLSAEIEAALASAQAMIVLCSPAAAASRWTDLEIAAFKRLHPHRPILAAIVAGEPFASEVPGREGEECFPPALRRRFDAQGRITAGRAEPIAADLRPGSEGLRLAKLKIVSGMLDLPLDDLVRREAGRRHRRMTWLAAASLAGMILTSGLSVAAIQARNEARQQRNAAEGLIEFMLTDLRKNLEPVGRLDALDVVGQRALSYYQGQDPSTMDAETLGRRSRALHLIGEIADRRGDLPGALKRFEQAAAGTSEALRREPDNGARIFDHAQSVYWVGYIAWQRGQLERAEREFTEYRRLAERLTALDPNNADWRMELSYAHSNLGTLLLESGRPAEAAAAFEQALGIVRSLANADPTATGRQQELGQSLAWLADAREQQGELDQALADRTDEAQIYRAILARNPRDSLAKRSLISAERHLGRLRFARGEVKPAIEAFDSSVRLADALVTLEPNNTAWLEVAALAHADRADALMATGPASTARPDVARAGEIADNLVRRDAGVPFWTGMLAPRALLLRAELTARAGDAATALTMATSAAAGLDRAYAGKKFEPDVAWLKARAELLAGDQSLALGRRPAATKAWAQIVSLTDDQAHMRDIRLRSLREAALKRLGRPTDTAIAAQASRQPDRRPQAGTRLLAQR